MAIPVVLQTWQWACCGDPFRIGSLVEWTLIFTPRLVGVPRPAIVSWEAHAERQQSGLTVLTDGQIHARPWAAIADGPVDLRGAFIEDHHGFAEGVPPTVGRVRRIRLIAAHSDAWQPSEQLGRSLQLRDVKSSRSNTALPEEGILVNLDVEAL